MKLWGIGVVALAAAVLVGLAFVGVDGQIGPHRLAHARKRHPHGVGRYFPAAAPSRGHHKRRRGMARGRAPVPPAPRFTGSLMFTAVVNIARVVNVVRARGPPVQRWTPRSTRLPNVLQNCYNYIMAINTTEGHAMRINADRAIKALGIITPVSFEPTRLPEGELGGVNPARPGVIQYDPAQLLDTLLTEGYDPRHNFAHELVHVAQQERIGDPALADWLYRRENAERGYIDNRFEQEADRLADVLAPLVEITA